jgi:hypothetical protein
MSCLVLKLVRGASKTESAAKWNSAALLNEVFSFSFTLSEEGMAGALSHLAFLDLDFFPADSKREGESDLVGDADA